MRLRSLAVKNFRALENVEVDFDTRVSVVVGPNAVGKTTLLEAIRLAKGLLAPRTPNESNQVLLFLGAAPLHAPQELIVEALLRDVSQPLESRCRFELTNSELDEVEQMIPQIVTNLTLARFGQSFANPAASIGILSSPLGAAALKEIEPQVRDYLQSVRKKVNQCRLHLILDPLGGNIRNVDPLGSLFIGFLDRRQPPNMTVFSYFPADRAMPSMEQSVQLGSADAAIQVESHNSQPQAKYTRLKNTIFGTIIRGDEDKAELLKAFECIFAGILRGRRLSGVGVGSRGLLSIRVQDTETSRDFDIDGMSSGEKGLILTFLLIARSLVEGGLVLLDEPELHLNPAVCKDLLNFLVENYVAPKNLQVIVCSHSPEILAGAFDNEERSLYHLLSEKVLTKVRYSDEDEISEALAKLGTSEGEGLLYKATVFVEGDDDVDVLEAGFGDLLRRYKLKGLGGRGEVERQIAQLQDAERRDIKLSPRYFVFDLDQKPTALESSPAVRVLQWDRTCLENYLIDMDVLTDFLKDPDMVKTPLSNQAEVSRLLKGLAMAQLDGFIASRVYATFGFDGPGLRANEIHGRSVEQIADASFERLARLKAQYAPLEEGAWKSEFLSRCRADRQELEPIWDMRWVEFCDGKRLFRELYQTVAFKLSLSKLKKRIMSEMRSRATPNWRTVESLLRQLIGAP